MERLAAKLSSGEYKHRLDQIKKTYTPEPNATQKRSSYNKQLHVCEHNLQNTYWVNSRPSAMEWEIHCGNSPEASNWVAHTPPPACAKELPALLEDASATMQPAPVEQFRDPSVPLWVDPVVFIHPGSVCNAIWLLFIKLTLNTTSVKWIVFELMDDLVTFRRYRSLHLVYDSSKKNMHNKKRIIYLAASWLLRSRKLQIYKCSLSRRMFNLVKTYMARRCNHTASALRQKVSQFRLGTRLAWWHGSETCMTCWRQLRQDKDANRISLLVVGDIGGIVDFDNGISSAINVRKVLACGVCLIKVPDVT